MRLFPSRQQNVTVQDDRLGSVEATVGIRRTGGSSEDGARFIGYWVGAILADLNAQWNAATPGRIYPVVPDLARAANRWFTDSWRAAHGTPRTRYEVTSFSLRVFSQPGQQGDLLAEVDVLTGHYHIYA